MAPNFGYTEGSGKTIGSDEQNVSGVLAHHQIVQVWEKLVEFVFAPTINTAAYADGYNLGGLITINNAARLAGQNCRVDSITIVDQAVQLAAMDVLFFRDSITAPTDHATWNPSDADLLKFRGGVHISSGDYVSLSTNACACVPDIGLRIPNLVGTSLYAAIAVRGTPDYVAATDIQVVFTVSRL